MNLLVKAAAQGQTIASVTPASAGWQHVGFEAVRLSAGDVLSREYADAETCVVVVAGRVTLAAGVVCWAASPIKFQADMGILLTFMFVLNMVGALVLIPALSHFLLRNVRSIPCAD